MVTLTDETWSQDSDTALVLFCNVFNIHLFAEAVLEIQIFSGGVGHHTHAPGAHGLLAPTKNGLTPVQSVLRTQNLQSQHTKLLNIFLPPQFFRAFYCPVEGSTYVVKEESLANQHRFDSVLRWARFDFNFFHPGTSELSKKFVEFRSKPSRI